MISARHTTNRQSFKKVTCPFKLKVRAGVGARISERPGLEPILISCNWSWIRLKYPSRCHTKLIGYKTLDIKIVAQTKS